MLCKAFDLKSTQHDLRKDDIYIQDPKDSEEPHLPSCDNIAHKLVANKETIILSKLQLLQD